MADESGPPPGICNHCGEACQANLCHPCFEVAVKKAGFTVHDLFDERECAEREASDE